MTLLESILALVIAVGVPVQGHLFHCRFEARRQAGDPNARVNSYLSAIVMLWALATAVLGVWSMSDRSWAVLGFRWSGDVADWISAGVALLGVGFFLSQFVSVTTSSAVRSAFAQALKARPNVIAVLPTTSREQRAMLGLGVTAGVTEEILFRGFLIWALAQVMPVWIAAGLSWAAFTAAHLYQGKQGLIQVAVVGAVLTGLYVASGSLWPLIALHIGVDVLNFITVWRVRRSPEGQATFAEVGRAGTAAASAQGKATART
ncbi:MAG: CPBP family intramembrane glutamic endopeptidase [Maricaulaceae bacterium]